MPLAPGLRFRYYEVLARLGAGGMGEVYRARDHSLDRFVAVKALPTGFSRDPDRMSRFVHEAKILASLNHPGIGAIYGLEELPDGDRCLVLELVNGVSLSERLREAPLTIIEACRIAEGIAEALEAAHENGVIHRDLKPGNVMLTERGRVKVLDFGLARQVTAPGEGAFPSVPRAAASDDDGTTLTRTVAGSVVEGTPAYMSPEQVRGESQDERTDVFSFGCVLFECLTGRPPFRRDDLQETVNAVLSAEPAWPLLPADTPPAIVSLLSDCLAKDAARRLQRMEEARHALETVRGEKTPADAVPLPANNLPRDLSRFVGREAELADCADELDRTRLLTLTGIGGSGKTRLARRLGANLLKDYPEGVWFVDLAPLRDPERVVLTLASMLAVKEEPAVPLVRTLTEHVKAWRALLVLDNCEHLRDACSRLARSLLESCADLKLVATSREPLGVEGERVLTVRALSMPPRDEESDAQALMTSDAGRLFADRARAVDANFELNADNAAAVAEICRKLDGIPLAIELAASRVKLLTVDQIRDRIEDRFRLLEAGDRTESPRGRTLRASIQWSYDQLIGREQQMFRTFSVFRGGWTLAAATAVSGRGEDEFAVLDALSRIADKSLIAVERGSGSEARYTMLETVKQYALERLRESHDEEETRDKHLGYYLSLARQMDQKRLESGKTGWRKVLDREMENLLAAHAWCDRAEDGAEAGLRLAFALRNYWLPRGTLDLGFRVSMEALNRPGGAAPTLERGKVLLTAAVLAFFTGRYVEGEELVSQCLSIMRREGESATLSTTLTALALIALAQKQRTPALAYITEAVQTAREAGAWSALSGALNTLGDIHRLEGRLEEATAAYEEAVEKNLQEGNLEDSAVGRCNLGRAWITRGDLARARTILFELLAGVEALDSKHVLWGILDVAAGLALASGNNHLGIRLYGASDALLQRSNSRRDEQDALFLTPLLAGARESLGDDSFDATHAAGYDSPHEVILDELRAWLEQTGPTRTSP